MQKGGNALRNLPPHISIFLNIELFHLFGFTDNPSAWQPGNVTPARPNNRAINATKLQEKCEFNKNNNEMYEIFMKIFKSNGFENGIF